MVKGRLYTCAAKSQERRAAQTAIYEILDLLVRVMAPILVFTAEEIWQNMPKEEDKPVTSVHLLDWPAPMDEATYDKEEGLNFRVISEAIQLIPDVAKILEEKRSEGLIGSSFDAKIKLLTKSRERYKFLESLKDDLPEIFKVSQVEIGVGDNFPDVAIEVSKADGEKCQRCWNYNSSVGKSEKHPSLCDKCEAAIGEEKTN